MNDRRFATVVAAVLVVLAAVSRVVPHPWNFTPMTAVALYAGARLGKTWIAALAVVACLALGDLALGLFPYGGMEWVYGAFVAAVVVGRALRTRPGALPTLLGALAAGAIFFAVSNFGVWVAGGLYPRTASGLVECYTAALPFYRNQIAGDLLFTCALFGLHALAIRVRMQRLATA
jgi:hypothetical protein